MKDLLIIFAVIAAAVVLPPLLKVLGRRRGRDTSQTPELRRNSLEGKAPYASK